jgi:hypothetical protein
MGNKFKVGDKVSLRDDTGLSKEEFKKRNHIIIEVGQGKTPLYHTKSRQTYAEHHLKEHQKPEWKG